MKRPYHRIPTAGFYTDDISGARMLNYSMSSAGKRTRRRIRSNDKHDAWQHRIRKRRDVYWSYRPDRPIYWAVRS